MALKTSKGRKSFIDLEVLLFLFIRTCIVQISFHSEPVIRSIFVLFLFANEVVCAY